MCEFQEYGGECRGSGSSLLIFIELAPSKNDNCEEVKGLLSASRNMGASVQGCSLFLMLLKYVLSKQISCCVEYARDSERGGERADHQDA